MSEEQIFTEGFNRGVEFAIKEIAIGWRYALGEDEPRAALPTTAEQYKAWKAGKRTLTSEG